MQIAGHTLSVVDALRRSWRRLYPSRSQSFISFAALCDRAMWDIFSSSLPEPESFGRRITRRSCSDILIAASECPPSSLRPQTTLRDEGTISGHNIARDLSVTVDV